MPSHITQVKKALIAASAPTLKVAGFKKAGHTFYRRSNDLLHIVKFSGEGCSRSTKVIPMINLCIVPSTEAESDKHKAAVDYYRELEPAIIERLSALRAAAEKQPNLWLLNTESDYSPQIDQIVNSLVAHGLPFLQNYQDGGKLLAALEAGSLLPGYELPSELCHAKLLDCAGRRLEAAAILQKSIGAHDHGWPIGAVVRCARQLGFELAIVEHENSQEEKSA